MINCTGKDTIGGNNELALKLAYLRMVHSQHIAKKNLNGMIWFNSQFGQ